MLSKTTASMLLIALVFILASATAGQAVIALRFSPPNQIIPQGEQGRLSIIVDDIVDLRAISVAATFDADILSTLDLGPGALFTDTGCELFMELESDMPGQWAGNVTIMDGSCSFEGPGELFYWNFFAESPGISPVEATSIAIFNRDGYVLESGYLGGWYAGGLAPGHDPGGEIVADLQYLWAAGHPSNPYPTLRMRWWPWLFTQEQWDAIPGADSPEELDGLPFTLLDTRWPSLNGEAIWLQDVSSDHTVFALWSDPDFTVPLTCAPGEYDLFHVELGPTTVIVGELTGAPAPAAGAMSLGLHPNPFNPTTSLRFSAPSPRDAELAVFDVAGRRMAELWSGALGAGEVALEWNGCDAAGHPLPAGVYLFRLRDAAGDDVVCRGVLAK
jgi:hypothetical protein